MSIGFLSSVVAPKQVHEWFLLFAGCIVAGIIMILLDHIRCFFFPRKDQYYESYPFQLTIHIVSNLHRALDVIYDIFENIKKRTGKKTTILIPIGLPNIVFTGDVENITYVLKTNFENFGKAGPAFKPKFQGVLGNGIFNADGHTWYAHRKTSALIFKLNRFKTSVLEVFHDDMDQCIEWIRQRDGKAFDFHGLMHRFTLESIARLAFGLKFDVIQKDRVQFAEDFDACTWSINNSMLDPFWLLKRYFTYEGWQYFAALNRINQFVSKIIAERRRTIAENSGKVTADMNDLLSLYLDKDTTNNTNNNMKDEDGQGSSSSYEDTYLEPNDSTLRDVVLNMIIAGRDTTAQALSWSFYRMCLHDGMQEKLRTEIIEVLKNTGEYEILRANNGLGSIAYDTLQQMKYVEAFIMEVLRLHPSVPKEAKCCFKDDILPDGTEVKKGDLIAFIPWCMGRDPDLWGNDCLEFKPERFLDCKTNRPSPFVFIAFQAGPRTCLGQNFAMLEMKTAIARTLISFALSFAQDPNTITYENSLTLPMKGGMLMTAKAI